MSLNKWILSIYLQIVHFCSTEYWKRTTTPQPSTIRSSQPHPPSSSSDLEMDHLQAQIDLLQQQQAELLKSYTFTLALAGGAAVGLVVMTIVVALALTVLVCRTRKSVPAKRPTRDNKMIYKPYDAHARELRPLTKSQIFPKEEPK